MVELDLWGLGHAGLGRRLTTLILDSTQATFEGHTAVSPEFLCQQWLITSIAKTASVLRE